MANYPGVGVQAHYRATVQSADVTGRWWVTINGDPLNLRPAVLVDIASWPASVTGPASTGTAHTHGPSHALTSGDRVIVGTIGGSLDDLFIIGRILT